MDTYKLIDYKCRCGSDHRVLIHWKSGITCFKCSNIVDNKKILLEGIEVMCSECGFEIWHDDITDKSDWCQDCIDGDSEKYEL